MAKMKVGLIGCGNIAADLCIALQKETIPAEVVAVMDIDESRARGLIRTFQLNASIGTLAECAAQSDFLVECAVGRVVKDVLDVAMQYRRNCLIMSVGGLMEHLELLASVREKNVEIRLPSGAVCGLDGIRAAMEAGLHSVTLTTRKPPKGLAGAPYLVNHGITLDNLTEPMVVFEGSAGEATEAFPANVNVAGALSLAGIGPVETRVRIIADPHATSNSHEIVAEGAFGRLTTITENLPSPRNPKSSYLASLSACAEMRAAATAFAAAHGV